MAGRRLVLDLDSAVVDAATEWVEDGELQRLVLNGRSDDGLEKFNRDIQRVGMIQKQDFGDHSLGLDFDGCKLTAKQVLGLAKALRHDRTVSALSLAGNHLGDSGADILSAALLQNIYLARLSLARNSISAVGVEGLAAVLAQDRLVKLDLHGNHIRSEGLTCLASSLSKNHSLIDLNVSSNEIGDDGAQALAAVISEETPCLVTLNLAGNQIASGGSDALSEAFERSSTLASLKLEDQCLTKQPRWAAVQDLCGQEVTVVCSRAGVAIMARQPVRMVWGQDETQVEISFERHDLTAADHDRIRVEFTPKTMKVVVADEVLFDKELHGEIKTARCTWKVSSGELRIVLTKAHSTSWPQIAI